LALGAQQLCDELAAAASVEAEIVVGSFPAATTGAPAALVRDLVIERSRHGFLDGHRIRGVPVLPIAMVLEWFARWLPDAPAVAIRELRVLRGVRLTGFDAGRAERLVMQGRRTEAGLAIELVGADGAKHYTAVIEAADVVGVEAPLGPLTPWLGSVYGRHGLFHGPGFQVIERVDGVSPRGMSARLTGTAHQAWPGNWRLDPALLDGGLQLAVLWARHLTDRAVLPTAIDRAVIAMAGPVTGAVRCVLEGRAATGDRVVSDVRFVDDAGRTIAELRGVETHALPSEAVEQPAGQRTA
jgi:hypothetical protein